VRTVSSYCTGRTGRSGGRTATAEISSHRRGRPGRFGGGRPRILVVRRRFGDGDHRYRACRGALSRRPHPTLPAGEPMPGSTRGARRAELIVGEIRKNDGPLAGCSDQPPKTGPALSNRAIPGGNAGWLVPFSRKSDAEELLFGLSPSERKGPSHERDAACRTRMQ
jgi:hypothetical protein